MGRAGGISKVQQIWGTSQSLDQSRIRHYTCRVTCSYPETGHRERERERIHKYIYIYICIHVIHLKNDRCYEVPCARPQQTTTIQMDGCPMVIPKYVSESIL